MDIEVLSQPLTVCKVASVADIDLSQEICFAGRTDSEISLVCPTANVPAETLGREDGWRGMRVRGELDFSLVGILAAMTGALARHGIPVFAVSTFDTDYLLVKEERLAEALDALAEAGFRGE